jgi:hypothetical protein
LFAVLAVAIAAPAAFAGGSNVYPNGAEGFWMGAAPPPGTYYVNYTLWYTSHEYVDNDGDEIKVGPLAGFKNDVLANTSRFIYISDKELFGANIGAHIFINLLDVDVKTAGGNSHVSGLGDTIINPFILCWHWPNLHITTGVDIYVPTGDYDEGRVVNLSANAFVYEPVFAVTYMTPMEGLTVSAKFMYDFPEVNKDYTNPFTGASGNLEYGEEFHFDYSIDYMVKENLKAGIGGYFYQQTTKDEFNGVSNPAKGRVFAVGPGFEYSPERFEGRLTISYRAQFEMAAKNRPEGMSNWLRAVWVF